MGLNAVVEPTPSRLRVLVRNDGAEPASIPRALLAPALAFEVTDARGSPLALGPPPVPPAELDAEATTVSPGDTLDLEYATRELFAGDLPHGRLRLRFVVDSSSGRIESPWVALDG